MGLALEFAETLGTRAGEGMMGHDPGGQPSPAGPSFPLSNGGHSQASSQGIQAGFKVPGSQRLGVGEPQKSLHPAPTHLRFLNTSSEHSITLRRQVQKLKD